MVDRSVSVRLRAETGQYVSEMGRAADATKKVGDTAASTEKQTNQAQQKQQTQARTFAQSLAQSARENEQAWSTVGKTLVGVGAAVTGLGVAVLKTGISYNQLQQESRAALTTLLGSAEAANAQMDKLDEFARSSPFSKQVFIEAQQQLIGFGTAAEDVIPILDAVQNAVAATGGSNQDIAELVNVIAKVGATGKMTAQDLNEFGTRGVDAATIIGEQMGKTGAQIREEITAGTLDADVAIQALTDGMQSRFGGAADAVKNTFSGALDRVSAAWRDLSATIAEPLVSQSGGGIFVGLINEIADVMRALESLPDGVLQVGGAFTGLAGAVTLAAGTIALAIPKYFELKTAMGALGITAKTTAIAVGAVTAGLTLAAIGLSAWASSQAEAQARVDSLRDSLDQTTGALTDMSASLIAESWTESVGWLDKMRGQADSAADAAENLGLSLSTLTDAAMGDADALDDVFSVIGRNADETATLALRNAEAMGMTTSEYVAYATQVREALNEQRSAVEGAQEEQSQMAEATGESADAQGEMADATGAATEEVQAQVDALNTLIDTLSTLAGNVLGQREAMRNFEAAMDDATASIEENGRSFDISTEKGRANQEALDGVADSAWDVITAMQQNGASAEALHDTMAGLRTDFIDTATEMGLSKERARELADQFGLIPDSVVTEVEADTEGAEESLTEMQEMFAGAEIKGIEVDVDTANAEANVNDLTTAIENIPPQDINIGANTDLAATILNGFLVGVDTETGTITIDGNPQPANQTLAQLLNQIGLSTEDVTIDGDPIPADMTLAELINQINNSEEDVIIGGNNTEGKNALASLLRQVGYSEEKVKIGGDTSLGQNSLNAFRGQVDGTDADIDVDARTGSAETAINHTARDRTSTINVKTQTSWASGGPVEGLATGGPIHGPGTGTSDSIVASGPAGPARYRLSNGEHVWTDKEVRAVGGHGAVMSLRSMARTGELRSVLGFADGGPLSPYSFASTPAPSVTVTPQISSTAALHPDDRALLASVAAGTRRLEVNGRVFAEIVDETNRRFGGKGTL